MKLTITSLELKNPLKFFALSYHAMKIIQQLRGTAYVKKRTTGFWTKHYTMTLWNDEKSLKDFSKSGHHLQAMKTGSRIASEIRTLTIDAEDLPSWKEAKALLQEHGKIIRY